MPLHRLSPAAVPALAALLLLPAPGEGGAAAAAPACRAAPVQPVIEVQIRLPMVEHDLSLDGQGIARRAREAEPRIDHDHDWVDGAVGLTTVDFVSDFSLGLVLSEAEDGVCVQVGRVRASFGFSRMTVHVASAYGPASCAYKEVLNHEHKHVQIFREEMLKAERPLTDAIVYALRTGTPFHVGNPAGAEARALQLLAEGVRPVVARMWQEGDIKHRLLDSTESYRRTERHCDDW